MNAKITKAAAIEIHHCPDTEPRPVHRNAGLWIFRWGTGGVSPSVPQPRLRKFEFYCISHMYDGHGFYETPAKGVQPVHPGACILVPPQFIHNYGAAPEQFYCEDTINFTGPLADMLYHSGVFVPGVHELGLSRRLQPIIELASDPSDNAQLNANFALQKLFFDLYNRRFQQSAEDRFSRIDALLEELKTDPCKWWTLSDMAQFCNWSEDQFRRLFFERVGMKPKLYLDNLRMNHAARQLVADEAAIADIASAHGYSDPFHFSRRFKAIMGLSPRQYREEAERL